MPMAMLLKRKEERSRNERWMTIYRAERPSSVPRDLLLLDLAFTDNIHVNDMPCKQRKNKGDYNDARETRSYEQPIKNRMYLHGCCSMELQICNRSRVVDFLDYLCNRCSLN